jgi:hypothetical protein
MIMTNKQEMTEKNHEKPVRIAGVPANIHTRFILNSIQT